MKKKIANRDTFSFKFIIPLMYLILGAMAIIVSVDIYNKIIQVGLFIVGAVFAIWGSTRIMRIFFKIFLEKMSDK